MKVFYGDPKGKLSSRYSLHGLRPLAPAIMAGCHPFGFASVLRTSIPSESPQKRPAMQVYFYGDVCLKKSEPILRRTPTNKDTPPLPRFARQHQRKMFLAFRICARPISSKKERTFFFGVLPSKYSGSWRGDNSIRSGMAEFPPHPPSAMPSLPTANFLAAALFRKPTYQIVLFKLKIYLTAIPDTVEINSSKLIFFWNIFEFDSTFVRLHCTRF